MINFKKNRFQTIIRVIYISAFVLFLSSCDKDENPIPTARFSVTIDLNLPDYNKDAFTLYQVHGRRVGVSGVLVVRGIMSDGTSGYNVFERYCPYDKKSDCTVKFSNDFATASCSCCQSQFFIASTDGDVLEGPSRYPLKTYKTSLSGNRLTIYN